MRRLHACIALRRTHEHQCELLAVAQAKIATDDEPYALLAIDSIMGLFRVEVSR